MRLFFAPSLSLLFTFFFSLSIHGQTVSLERVEPPHWWTGMENGHLQLLIYGQNIADAKPSLNYNGITIKTVSRLESNNYLFVDLNIAETTQPGSFELIFTTANGQRLSYNYELKQKGDRHFPDLSVNGSDVMYLITPDRFANGNPANDATDNTLEKLDRHNPDGRHGGDLQGIRNHLDYIQELGVTTLWLNPILENNQERYSYHGYGISDFYNTDARFGTNEDFLALVEDCHQRGMKMIMDQVFNHCGAGHWWMDDLPAKNWLNQWESYTNSSFTNITISDPYRSQSDYDLHTKGWFDTNLPDLNQENPFMETYLIQNSLWWIEYAQLDGIRMDTYPYPNKHTMARWLQRLYLEYPNFYVVAETSEESPASLSYWNKGQTNKDGYDSQVNSVSDYPLYYAMLRAFGEENSIYRIYETLAYDYLYGSPFNNKVFNGNHDVPRLYNELNGDIDKIKLSMAFTLTTRGIPQLYYGDELLFEGPKPDGVLRKDFPGGWPGDQRNAFSAEERTAQENDLFNYVSTILNWRKNAKEIHQGQLKHYKPWREKVYVYFRYLEDSATMVILNNSDENIEEFSLDHYQESLLDFSAGYDIISQINISNLDAIPLAANQAYIIQLR